MRKKTPGKHGKRFPDPGAESDLSAEELFLRAMADVVPIGGKTKRILPAPSRKSAAAAPTQQGPEAVRPAETDDAARHWNAIEHGHKRLVRRLKRGEFPVEEDLDLHGFTQAQARKELETFLLESSRRGLTCVRVIHGKGWNSPNRLSVLRKRVPEWLREGANAELVAAYASARLRDGGTGAVYVLLRRDKYKGV